MNEFEQPHPYQAKDRHLTINFSHPDVDVGHAATARNIDNGMLSSDEKSKNLNRLPTLTKQYGGAKKNILVNLNGAANSVDDGHAPNNHTRSMRNLSQAKMMHPQLHIPLGGAGDKFSGPPRNHQEYLTNRQNHTNNSSKMHSKSQQLLPLHKNSSQQFDRSQYSQTKDRTAHKKEILTLNKLPEIVNHSSNAVVMMN